MMNSKFYKGRKVNVNEIFPSDLQGSLDEFFSHIKIILYVYHEGKETFNFSRSNCFIKSVHKYAISSETNFLGGQNE